MRLSDMMWFYDDYRRFHICLDYWSIQASLELIEGMTHSEYPHIQFEIESKSQYYSNFAEEINGIQNMAADLWIELNRLIQFLGLTLRMRRPNFSDVDDLVDASGIAWFNYAACLTDKCNVVMALVNEGYIDDLEAFDGKLHREVEKHQTKRRNAVAALPKNEHNFLIIGVFSFLTRYYELYNAYNTILGCIDTMDDQMAMIVKNNGEVKLNDASYL